MKSPHLAALALLLGLITGPARAFTIPIDSTASSFLKDASNSTYVHGMSIQNYQAGYNKTADFTAKNWFIFDIPPVGPMEAIVSVLLHLYLPIFPPNAGFGYGSEDPSETFGVFGLSMAEASFVSADAIMAGTMSGAAFDAWFPLIGTGPVFGSATVTESDEGTFVILPFGASGVDATMSSTGGKLLFGGKVLTIDNPPAADVAEGIFHHTHPYGVAAPPMAMTPAPFLSLEIISVPEPGAAAFLLLGSAAWTFRRRRLD